MSSFKSRIRKSLADKHLQNALDANAQRRVEGSRAAFASLPDHQERRKRAHQIRAEVIANLDQIAAQFLSKAEENGFIVHRAKNADEAVKIALKIIANSPQGTQRHTKEKTKEKKQKESFVNLRDLRSKKNIHLRSSLVAKSKSMVTEEIGLNEALEAAGHRVVETDLGEYIIQLRHEKPSHIITPAVHLRKEDVAKLFHEELGIPYTTNIPTLTETARQTLRQVFLNAEIGISGVNFGIAQSGTLCIVTNEGNGRMVTTLPRTHIAVMGMERLLPTMQDLALMLSLLPRSATTQKISVYTQFIQNPLPGQTRHLIYLDNGRAQLRQTPLNDSLFCIRCGACLNACPVFREIGGHAYASVYPGPIGSVISAGLFGADYAPLAQACTLCGACKDACPVEIDLPKMLLRVRAGDFPKAREKGAGLPVSLKTGLKAFRRVALDPNLFAVSQRTMGKLASSANRDFIPLPAWTGWGYSKHFPRPAEKTFREAWEQGIRNQESDSQESSNQESGNQDGRVQPPSPQSPNSRLLFIREAEALSAKIIPVTQPLLSTRLLAYLQKRGINEIQLGAGLAELFQNTEFARQRHASPNIAVGITQAVAAVAETGSILVAGENRDELSASLLPEIHIAVLHARDIYRTLEEVLALPQITQSSAASLISGPSRTADIEMTLTIGVHGPKELVVFLIDE